MIQPVHIVIGACGDKMMGYYFRKYEDAHVHLVPILHTNPMQCYCTLRVAAIAHKFKVVQWQFKNLPEKMPKIGDAPWKSLYQTTTALYPNEFLVVRFAEMPEQFHLSGGYETAYSVADGLELRINSIKADFSHDGNEWQVSNVKNGD